MPPTALAHAHLDGFTVAYEDTGPRDAPALVLLHGFTDSHRMWRRLVPELAAQWHVVALDFPGHGNSDPFHVRPDFDTVVMIPLLGRAVEAVCDHARVTRPVLVGQSLGGMVAAYLAATRPDWVRSSVLIDPPLYLVDPDVWPATPFADLFAGLEELLRHAQSSENPESILLDALASMPSMTADGTFLDELGHYAARDLAWSWSRADCEALAAAVDSGGDPTRVWGPHSPDTPIPGPVTVLRADPALWAAFYPEHESRLHRSTPHAAVFEATGCGHLIHHDNPTWLLEQLTRLLAALPTG